MKLVVGCPIRSREWIIEQWINHIGDNLSEAQIPIADVELAFALAPDDPTREALNGFSEHFPVHLVDTPEPIRRDRRDWCNDRYHQMVTVRNLLLEKVRELEPDYFLSVDSDILLHPRALVSMLEVFKKTPDVWAVGSKTFLSQSGRLNTNVAFWSDRRKDGFYRKDLNDYNKAHVLMAIKLMKPEAYNVDYEFHRHGEDFGWSKAVDEAGGILYWDGRITNKHVMTPMLIDVIDRRCGW